MELVDLLGYDQLIKRISDNLFATKANLGFSFKRITISDIHILGDYPDYRPAVRFPPLIKPDYFAHA